MPSQAMVRSGALHVASAMAGAFAAVSFAASHSVDLYAIVDQLNVVVADVSKLIALVTPIITGGYAIYKATTKSKLIDIAADPAVRGVITTPEMARVVPSEKVQPVIADLPAAAKVPAVEPAKPSELAKP